MSGVSFFKKNAKQAFHGELLFLYVRVRPRVRTFQLSGRRYNHKEACIYSLCLICSLQSIDHMQEISTEVSVLGGVVFASDAAAFGGVAPKSKSAKGSFFGGYPPVADGGVALVLSWK